MWIYQLVLKKPKDGQSEFFFGSLAAIYEELTQEEVGCKVEWLWEYGITPEHPYQNKKCTISKVKVVRKKRKEK